MKRRHFLRTTAAASAAITLIPGMACSSARTAASASAERNTGLILYTVRNEMNKDPLGTLDKVAEMGYNWIELASYSNGKFYNMEPSILKNEIEQRGMSLISSHNGLNPNNVDEVVEAAAEAGLIYLVMPSLGGVYTKSLDGYKKAADFMNEAGVKCQKVGMKLGFHNHDIEFRPIDNQIPYNILVENTDPDLVTFELDLAWIKKGNQASIEYFKKYPGRFELWHVKDLSAELQDATLGEGSVEFGPIFKNEKLSGMKYFFVEQDSSRTRTPLENIKISRDFLFSEVF